MTDNTTHPRPDLPFDQRLQYLADRVEIQDLMVRYALGQDLHQAGDNGVLEQWDTVFAPESTVDYSAAGGPPLKDIHYRVLVDVMRGSDGSMSGLLKWQHFQGVSAVDVDGDTAVARTQHLHTHKGGLDGQGWNLIETGFFVDRLVRRPEGWRIVHRTLEIIWMDSFPTV
ncbi:nuclear transport factor 2 family protein [Streptomyces sp. MI02-2A]|uniref:nuclear transport factor 2 family protein n=1 Tax=unclassified Streptomyces TaxID=2593676 RepID=UPI000E273AA8|nr:MULTISPECIES: nuclear transport factor 2 family protein [unclassified Streptomyces]MDX3263424.1 nuclear transport factor 2 family protein [Streptomyces sp. MI02-2A]REE63372.1 SnoaL-like protein [Streptomyces sp. 3212.3]